MKYIIRLKHRLVVLLSASLPKQTHCCLFHCAQLIAIIKPMKFYEKSNNNKNDIFQDSIKNRI